MRKARSNVFLSLVAVVVLIMSAVPALAHGDDLDEKGQHIRRRLSTRSEIYRLWIPRGIRIGRLTWLGPTTGSHGR